MGNSSIVALCSNECCLNWTVSSCQNRTVHKIERAAKKKILKFFKDLNMKHKYTHHWKTHQFVPYSHNRISSKYCFEKQLTKHGKSGSLSIKYLRGLWPLGCGFYFESSQNLKKTCALLNSKHIEREASKFEP